MEGKKQETAAAAASMSVRSARKWQRGSLPTEAKKPRTWRTREDPFAEIRDRDVVPLLGTDEKSVLQATTLLGWVQDKHPGKYDDGLLRTLQRRLRDWRALHGPPKEVFFEQQHVPGREGAFDFTDCGELGVTIGGEAFEHLLFELVLTYSSWTWVDLAFGETFEAMSAGIQGAVWDAGGVPHVLRSDNLSAATHDLKHSAGRTLTQRYRSLLEHYGATSTRIEPGESHQNGAVEQRHSAPSGDRRVPRDPWEQGLRRRRCVSRVRPRHRGQAQSPYRGEARRGSRGAPTAAVVTGADVHGIQAARS